MKKTIYCKTTAKGIQSFYVEVDCKSYYLFDQKYYVGVRDYFRKGVSVNDLQSANKHYNAAVRKTANKLRSYLQYVEKEYDVVIYDKRNKQKSKTYRKFQAEKARRGNDLLNEYYLDCAS